MDGVDPTIVVVNLVKDVPIAHLVRDTTAIARVPFYVGAISNVGIMLWCATISICFFTSAVLRINDTADTETVYFLLSAGAFTLALMLDDAFLFHKYIFINNIGWSSNFLFIMYITAAIIIFLCFKKGILGSNFILLLLSIGFLLSSEIFDKINEFGLFYILKIKSFGVKDFLEEACKLLGITGWFSYFTLTCFAALSRNYRKA